MPFFEELLPELETYLDKEQIDKIQSAYQFAESAHEGQSRHTGEPYISHPVAVAHILAVMKMDHQSIMAAILHDVIEDTSIDKDVLAERFGEEVAELVDGVSKLTQINFESKAEAQAENFRKMVLAMVRDIRVILVKLADRLHNMRTLYALQPAKQRRIAVETLEIYAPIANRLGMHNFRIELEDLGFATLYPLRFRIIKEAVKKIRRNRKHIINQIEIEIKEQLEKHHLPPCAVWGREKHLYSIYQKMRDKHLSFAEIMDVYAFRIVTDKLDTCYRVLGVIHNLYKPMPERFKDYIAIPKINGYQSLHTTLFGLHGVPIEIQIRTVDMNNMAENGIAGHWLYKSKSGRLVHDTEVRAREWLKNLMEMQQSTGNSLEFIENVKIDLFPEEVYVFTPKGNIIELLNGATPIDFAYAIHSDIGNSCIAAKVDRRLVPLSTPLNNGQTVEIITGKNAHPNPAWLNFVVTGKAKTNIRHFLKTQRRTESIVLGQNLLEKALTTLSITWGELLQDNINKVLRDLSYKSLEDLNEAIGLGNEMPLLVASRLLGIVEDKTISKKAFTEKAQPLIIKGCDGLMIQFPECCYPIPGDRIVAFLNKGRGLVIHGEHCRLMSKLQQHPEKCINVSWAENIDADFRVAIRAEVANQRGVLALIASAISDMEANIENISIAEHEGLYSVINLLLSVHDRVHLARVMRRIRTLKAVSKISRKL